MLGLLGDRSAEYPIPRTVARHVNHTLDPDILVEPDRPAARSLRIDLELFSQAFVSHVVDLLPIGAFGLLGSVNNTELSVPQRAVGHDGIASFALKTSS